MRVVSANFLGGSGGESVFSAIVYSSIETNKV